MKPSFSLEIRKLLTSVKRMYSRDNRIQVLKMSMIMRMIGHVMKATNVADLEFCSHGLRIVSTRFHGQNSDCQDPNDDQDHDYPPNYD